MRYSKVLLLIFSIMVLLEHSVSNACETCGGDKKNKIEITGEEISWLSDWMQAKQYSDEGKLEESLALYSQSISEVSKHGTLSLLFGLHNERARIYMELGDFESALTDFTYVINNSDSLTQDLLDARLGRAKIYEELGDEERCYEDVLYLVKNNPNVPKTARIGDYVVLSDFDTDSMKAEETKEFKKMLIENKICVSEEDVRFIPGKKCLVRMLPCNQSYLIDNQQTASDVIAGQGILHSLRIKGRHSKKDKEDREDKKESRRQEEAGIRRCQENCCTACAVGTVVCNGHWTLRAACIGGLELLRRQCYECCEIGFGTCGYQLKEFIESHGKYFFNARAEPYWDEL